MEKRQQATEHFLTWLANRAAAGDGQIQPFTQFERCKAMGYKMNAGMAVGNVQSRVDFACFRLGLPPLGLTAEKPFQAWEYDGKSLWAYPVASMTKAALERRWTPEDFDNLLAMSRTLPEVRKPWVSDELAKQRRQWAALFGSTEPGKDTDFVELGKVQQGQSGGSKAGNTQLSRQELLEEDAARLLEDLFTLERDVPDVTERTHLAKARIGQGRFRADVVEKWGRGEVCVLTGSSVPEMLVASHIKPWRESSNAERLDWTNGLLLVANADRLFDRHLMSFSRKGDEYLSVLHPRVKAEAAKLGFYDGMLLPTSHLGVSEMQRFESYMHFHWTSYCELLAQSEI